MLILPIGLFGSWKNSLSLSLSLIQSNQYLISSTNISSIFSRSASLLYSSTSYFSPFLSFTQITNTASASHFFTLSFSLSLSIYIYMRLSLVYFCLLLSYLSLFSFSLTSYIALHPLTSLSTRHSKLYLSLSLFPLSLSYTPLPPLSLFKTST